MIVLRSENGREIALPSDQSLWVHRARYGFRRGFLAESWQIGNTNGYFDSPTGLSNGDIVIVDMSEPQIIVVHHS